MAAAAGVTKKTQGLYERNERSPSAEYLAALSECGVDVLYVVTGILKPSGAVAVTVPEISQVDHSLSDDDPDRMGTGASVCSRLREERKNLGLDQQEIADALEVNIKTIGRWEKNIAIPSDKLGVLAGRGVDVLYVVTGVRLPVTGIETKADATELLSLMSNISDSDLAILLRMAKAFSVANGPH